MGSDTFSRYIVSELSPILRHPDGVIERMAWCGGKESHSFGDKKSQNCCECGIVRE